MTNRVVIPFRSDLMRRAFVPVGSVLAALVLPLVHPSIPLLPIAIWAVAVLMMMLFAFRSEPAAIVIDPDQDIIHAIYRSWLVKPMKTFDAHPFSIVRSYVRGQIPETVIVELATAEELPRAIRLGMFPPEGGRKIGGTYSEAAEPAAAAELRSQMASMGFTDQGYLLDFKERRGMTLI